MTNRRQKLFIGVKLKEIRQETLLTQAQFAAKLGISTSYLNQLENNQRHASATVLMALAENFSVDIRTLSDDESDRILADLLEASHDTLFDSLSLNERELKLSAQNAPVFSRAFIHLYETVKNMREHLNESDAHRTGLLPSTPYEEVRDFFHYIGNYIDPLDRAGENLAEQIKPYGSKTYYRLVRYLKDTFGIETVIELGEVASQTLRRFNAEKKTLILSPHSPESTKAFQIAHQIALLQQKDTIEEISRHAKFQTTEAEEICRIGLANYFAGSVLLPYTEFAAAAKTLRHDLDLLSARFDASLEQICHRLSTLQRPDNKGVPFFFARVDRAGNITKRHSATKLQFARYGSACPLWNVHAAFESSGEIIRQLAITPDGEKYICIATNISSPSGGFHDPVRRFALALGCEIKFIDEIVYGDGLNEAEDSQFDPIGISCRTCERNTCHQRSVPPVQKNLKIDANNRKLIPYSF